MPQINAIGVSRALPSGGLDQVGSLDGKPVKHITHLSDNTQEKELLEKINKLLSTLGDMNEVNRFEITEQGELLINGTKKEGLSQENQDLVDTISSLAKQILQPESLENEPLENIETNRMIFTIPLASFQTANTNAKKAIAAMHLAEREKAEALLEELAFIYQDLCDVDTSDQTDIQKQERIGVLKERFNKFSVQLKLTYEKRQLEQFNRLNENLVKMTKEYNAIITEIERAEKERDLEKLNQLKALKNTMHDCITECNNEIGRTSLTTNEFTAHKSHIMNFSSVVEKRLALLERITSLENKPGFFERRRLKKELSKCPTDDTMHEIYVNIKDKLKDSSQVVDLATIKSEYSSYPALKWGAKRLNHALTTPANWTTTHKSFMKQSESGRMYVSVSINEPLNIQEKGGVPAGLRKAEGYKERATNLMKTTSYIITDTGEQSSPVNTSFRGGQFPTVNAAKEAIEQIIASGVPLEELHINALLTPLSMHITPDKNLLVKHKKNIHAAIELLIQENRNEDAEKTEKLQKLKEKVSMSNFGVNEGAVGELRKKGKDLSWFVPGWHTSIKEYSNEASKNLTGSLNNTLKPKESLKRYKPEDLDRLGAIVQVGQEMEAVWATNAYAEARVGNNQFKLPALWKAMDSLLNVVCYTDCMSGKDRTGKVESQAQAYLDEIAMNTIEHKAKLRKKFEEINTSLEKRKQDKINELNNQRQDKQLELDRIGAGEENEVYRKNIKGQISTLEKQLEKVNDLNIGQWKENEKYLTAACFQPDDLDRIATSFVNVENTLENILKGAINQKLDSARKAVGIRDASGKHQEFMEPKSLPNWLSMKFKLGTTGISRTTPKRETPFCKNKAQEFPQLAASTIFSEYINWAKADELPITEDLLKKHRKKHIEASNNRLSQFASLDITAMNTGTPGFKVEGGEPLARSTCGFDRDYVLLKILDNRRKNVDTQQAEKEFIELVGLKEFDATTHSKFLKHFKEAEGDVHKLIELLKEIEEAKMQTFFPQTKVKA